MRSQFRLGATRILGCVVATILLLLSGDLRAERVHTRVRFFAGHRGAVVAFSPTAELFASGGTDRKVRLWDPSSGILVRTLTHSAPIQGIAFSPDGKMLAAGPKVIFSPDSLRLAALGKDTAVYPITVWEMPSGRLVCTLNISDEELGATVVVWNLAQRSVLWVGGVGNDERTIAWLPSGEYLATGGSRITHNYATAGATITFWNADTGEVVPEPDLSSLIAENQEVTAIAFSPDSRYLVTAESPQPHLNVYGFVNKRRQPYFLLRLFDLCAVREVRRFAGHHNEIGAVAFSPDGQLIASASADLSLQLWETNTGRQHARDDFGLFDLAVGSLAFSPDGRTLVTASEDGVRVRVVP